MNATATRTLRIRHDSEVDFANAGEPFGVITYTGRYTLGTERLGRDEIDALKEELAADPDAVALPVFAYVHSGATIRTVRDGRNPFSCPWDSGQSGIVYARGEAVRKAFLLPTTGEAARIPVPEEIKEKARALLENDVRLFDNCLQGDVWGYEVVETTPAENEDGEPSEDVVESCWGFYGANLADTGLSEAIKDAAPTFDDAAILAAWNART